METFLSSIEALKSILGGLQLPTQIWKEQRDEEEQRI